MLASDANHIVNALHKLPSRNARHSVTGKQSHLGKRLTIDQVLFWFFPWSATDYPGVTRGALSLIPLNVTYSAVKNWRSGYRPAPDAARIALAAALRSRCAAGLALAEQLEAELNLSTSKPKLKRIAGLRSRKHSPAQK